MFQKKIVLLMFLSIIVPILASEKAPQKVIELGNQLSIYSRDSIIIAAVKEQNSLGKTVSEIKKKDDLWKNTAGITSEMELLINSPCGQRLTAILATKSYFEEIFVMDSLGANVAMTDKTSDYWQGDEAKFQKSYNNGKGAIFVDDIEFDDSTQSYLVQISIPVIDGNRVIGAITFGINVDKIEE